MLPTALHLVLTPRRRAGRSSPVIAAPRSIGGGFDGEEAGDVHQLFATGQRGGPKSTNNRPGPTWLVGLIHDHWWSKSVPEAQTSNLVAASAVGATCAER
jgi:hypothetical protein